MAQFRSYETELLNYTNTGVLEVSSITSGGVSLTPVTPGVVSASTVVMVDSAKLIDTISITNVKLGATPVAQVDPASCTICSGWNYKYSYSNYSA